MMAIWLPALTMLWTSTNDMLALGLARGFRSAGFTAFDERGWLDRFCEFLSPGHAVLDMGCGAGQPIAAYLFERGFSVTGVDSSKTMIAMFQANLPGQEALISDMRTLALRRSFHGVLAWDSFFVPRDNQGETAASIRMRMRRGWTDGARA
jgi:SAM-dependent methyltransferase